MAKTGCGRTILGFPIMGGGKLFGVTGFSVDHGMPCLGLHPKTVRIRDVRVPRYSEGGRLLHKIGVLCWPTIFGFQ